VIDLIAHLKRLCSAHGPSGYEDPLAALLRTEWVDLVDSFEAGALGSLVGIKNGTGAEPRRRLMLCAHIDEIGLIVHDVTDGFLHVSRLGGIDPPTLAGQPVLVHTDPPLKGVIGVAPLHTLTEKQLHEYPPLADLWVDIGLPAGDVARLVPVGTPITLDCTPIDLQGGRLTGKALDDRACVAIVTACLEALKGRAHSWDVLAVASTQEEVGGYGAMTEAYRLAPDLAIALDVTFAIQPGMREGAFAFGAGVPIALGANVHPALYRALLDAAKRLEITVLPDPLPMSSGTDGMPIQVSRDGIPTALVEVAIRNMHSTVEVVEVADIARAGRLLAEFIVGLTPDFLATITWETAVSHE